MSGAHSDGGLSCPSAQPRHGISAVKQLAIWPTVTLHVAMNELATHSARSRGACICLPSLHANAVLYPPKAPTHRSQRSPLSASVSSRIFLAGSSGPSSNDVVFLGWSSRLSGEVVALGRSGGGFGLGLASVGGGGGRLSHAPPHPHARGVVARRSRPTDLGARKSIGAAQGARVANDLPQISDASALSPPFDMHRTAIASLTIAVASLTIAVAPLPIAIAPLTIAVAPLTIAVAPLTIAVAPLPIAVAPLPIAIASLSIAIAFANDRDHSAANRGSELTSRDPEPTRRGSKPTNCDPERTRRVQELPRHVS